MTALTAPVRRARRLAAQTPASRNRYVDFLRALSILAVVVGHWLISAPYVVDGDLVGVNMLAREPWTQWLTWVFQVMPVFFAVGGYSNTASWTAARRTNQTYGYWLTARLRRLTVPLIPLLSVWGLLAGLTAAFGVDPDLTNLGSQAALVPVWFLAVYVVIIAAGPLLIEVWRRWGWKSYLALAGAGLAVDVAVDRGWAWLGWANFILVWASIHQLGVAWRSGSLGPRRAVPLAAAAGLLAFTLVSVGVYPVAMVGVPGADATNNSPPTIALVAFGTMQVAILLSLEARARRLLEGSRVWTATVLVNGSIMTLYLWHMTAMVLGVGAMLLVGGLGLGLVPSTAAWWWSRPVWLLALGLATIPFLALLGRLEQLRPPAPGARPRPAIGLASVAATCVGLALLADRGVVGGFLGMRIEALALPILAGLWSLRAGRPPGGATPEGSANQRTGRGPVASAELQESGHH